MRTLSYRERQVIQLMAIGLTTDEIALKMEVSYETVKTFRSKAYMKLGVSKRSECLKKARELELLEK